jgi:hypothetical protein
MGFTYWWPIQVFAFILGITKVNTYLSWVYYKCKRELESINFCKQLTKALIYNKYDEVDGAVEVTRGRKR